MKAVIGFLLLCASVLWLSGAAAMTFNLWAGDYLLSIKLILTALLVFFALPPSAVLAKFVEIMRA